MINWNLIGFLGKDCEVKSTQSGSTLCEFSVAVSSGYGDKEKTPFVQAHHFGHPNIVVHARITDRADKRLAGFSEDFARGKVLFIEEIQSDLATAHRGAGET